MKSIIYFGKAALLFLIVIFSLLFMNFISLMMLLKLRKEEDLLLSESYVEQLLSA